MREVICKGKMCLSVSTGNAQCQAFAQKFACLCVDVHVRVRVGVPTGKGQGGSEFWEMSPTHTFLLPSRDQETDWSEINSGNLPT